MLEEIIDIIRGLFTLENFMVLLFTVDGLAVVGIFANAFTGRGAPPPKQRVKKRKPRKIDMNKVYFNLEEEAIGIDAEDPIKALKEGVGNIVKPHNKLAKFPPPLATVPDIFDLLVHNAKNGIDPADTKEKQEIPQQEDKEGLDPNEVKEVIPNA